jgi:Ca2+-binding EF-hand superfamily protein
MSEANSTVSPKSRQSPSRRVTGSALLAKHKTGQSIIRSKQTNTPSIKEGDDPDEVDPAERTKAKLLFNWRTKDTGGELGKEEFKDLIITLIKDKNVVNEKDGLDPTPMPKDKDLETAFLRADADGSGMVDEEEFLVLYRDVKNGKVEGLGGGLFSAIEGLGGNLISGSGLFVGGGQAVSEWYSAAADVKVKAEAEEEARVKAEEEAKAKAAADAEAAVAGAAAEAQANADAEAKAAAEAKAKAEEEARLKAEQEAKEALSPEETKQAKQLFDSRAKESNGEIGKESFKELINELIGNRNAQQADNGGEPTPMPSEKDLDAAFVRADADGSGMVDEEEFLVLYRDVKNGKVEGLGGGLFSAFFEAPFFLFKAEDPATAVARKAKEAAEEGARVKAEEEAKAKALEEARVAAEKKASEEAKAKAAAEEMVKAHQEAREEAEAARLKIEEEAKAKHEEHAKATAEHEEEVARLKAELEASTQAAAYAQARAAEEARLKAEAQEAHAKARADEEAAKAMLRAKTNPPPPPPPAHLKPKAPEPVVPPGAPPLYSRQSQVKEKGGALGFLTGCFDG